MTEEHEHKWGDPIRSHFAGTPHRRCSGCSLINLDLTDDDDEDYTLGSCGCTDYHMADCPTRTGVNHYGDESDYEEDWR